MLKVNFQCVGKPGNPLGLEPRDRKFKSCRTDQLRVKNGK